MLGAALSSRRTRYRDAPGPTLRPSNRCATALWPPTTSGIDQRSSAFSTVESRCSPRWAMQRRGVLAGIVTVGPFCEFTSLQGGPEEEARDRIIDVLRAELGADRFATATTRGAAMDTTN